MRVEIDKINLQEGLVLRETCDGLVFETKEELLCVSYTKEEGFEIGCFERGNLKRIRYSLKNGKMLKK